VDRSGFARARRLFLPGVYFAVVAGGLFLFFRAWHYDDPFITYRYAANLAEGHGFVYNPGERVLSTTSPLLALLLAGAHALGADIPIAANLLGALGLAAGGLLLFDIARRLGLPEAGWACALLYPTSAMLVSTLGSETPFYLAVCLGSVSFYLRRRYIGSAVLLALAVLARADAVVLGALLGADWLVRTWAAERSVGATLRAVPLPAVFAAGAVLLPWTVFSRLFYGSPLPATLAAKQAQGLLNARDLFLPGLWDLTTRLASYPHNLILLAGLPAGFAIAFSTRRRWLPILFWPVLYTIGYTLLGVPRYPWYYASLVPGAVAATGLALGLAMRKEGSPTADGVGPSGARTGWPRLIGGALLAVLFFGQLSDLNRLHGLFDDRYAIYRQIGLWLQENTPREASVGTLEVGIIGYFARPRPMIDFTGLLQPDIAARFHPGYRYAESAVWAAERYRPDVLVLTARDYPELQTGYIAGFCELAAEFPGADFGYDRDMVVYVCG
jgi:hypothetical protein